MIGNEVTLTVLGVRATRCVSAINAPKSVPGHREEIYERIKRELAGGEAKRNVANGTSRMRLLLLPGKAEFIR